MNSNRDWKKNWLNKGECTISKDKTPYILYNTLWMNIRGYCRYYIDYTCKYYP